MPGGDKTGNNGLGPRTGRGLGYCSGSDTPGYTKEAGIGGAFRRGSGAGFGRGGGAGFGRAGGAGRGRGLGNRNFFRGRGAVDFNDSDEKEFLKEQAEFYKKEIENINSRLEDIEK